jgi:hypothetical protein
VIVLTKVKNIGLDSKTIFIVTRERVEIEPGEEIEFEGEIELE